jgi:hypothetical protein
LLELCAEAAGEWVKVSYVTDVLHARMLSDEGLVEFKDTSGDCTIRVRPRLKKLTVSDGTPQAREAESWGNP